MALTLRQQIRFYQNMDEVYDQTMQLNRRMIGTRIRELRKTCPHDNLTYHPDPSGNNDSCYTCDECGEERKRFK